MVEKISISMASGAIAKFLEEMRALGLSDDQIIEALKREMEGDDTNGIAASDGH